MDNVSLICAGRDVGFFQFRPIRICHGENNIQLITYQGHRNSPKPFHALMGTSRKPPAYNSPAT